MRTETKTLDELQVGDEVTIWRLENGVHTWGQGGKLKSVEGSVVLAAPLQEYVYDLAQFDADSEPIRFVCEVEVPMPAEECLEYSDDCKGPVDYHAIGNGRAFPRCAHHWSRRLDARATSMEAYAEVLNPPSWFDPTYAGESWDEH